MKFFRPKDADSSNQSEKNRIFDVVHFVLKFRMRTCSCVFVILNWETDLTAFRMARKEFIRPKDAHSCILIVYILFFDVGHFGLRFRLRTCL